jgi:hypothetical protein
MATQAPVANGVHRLATVANTGRLADGHGDVGAAAPPERCGVVSSQVGTVLLRLPRRLAGRGSSGGVSRPPGDRRDRKSVARLESGLDNPFHTMDSGLRSPVHALCWTWPRRLRCSRSCSRSTRGLTDGTTT